MNKGKTCKQWKRKKYSGINLSPKFKRATSEKTEKQR